jgi:DNA-binding HxlR family transcriptional regulator
MTQRSALAPQPRSYNHPCLIAQALDMLGDRWTLIILRDLMSGLQHFNDILDNCDGLSPNVLSSRLKRLEAEDLVERHYHRELPPRVEYSLTEKGWAVRPILISFMDWSGNYLEGIEPRTCGRCRSTDFAARVLPAFWFEADQAEGVSGSLRVEIEGCTECSGWTYTVAMVACCRSVRARLEVNATLRTTPEGLFRFLRCEAPPEACGTLEGDAGLRSPSPGVFSRWLVPVATQLNSLRSSRFARPGSVCPATLSDDVVHSSIHCRHRPQKVR